MIIIGELEKIPIEKTIFVFRAIKNLMSNWGGLMLLFNFKKLHFWIYCTITKLKRKRNLLISIFFKKQFNTTFLSGISLSLRSKTKYTNLI